MRLWRAAVAAVAVVVLCGCSAHFPLGGASAPEEASSAPVAQGRDKAAYRAEAKLLADARGEIPTWAEACEPELKGRETTGFDVRMRPVPASARSLPDTYDRRRPVFAQLAPPAPDWQDGGAIVDVVDSRGTVLGSLSLHWTDRGWVSDGEFGVLSSDGESAAPEDRAAALVQLSRVLGGALDETATVGFWLFGRRGSVEGGVLMDDSEFPPPPPRPNVGSVYTGNALAGWLDRGYGVPSNQGIERTP